MAMSDRASTNGFHYEFDRYEIDPANRILMREGEVVPLTGRVFDVLLVLVENPGQLLEKRELIEKIWHDDFVEEGNLARNVSKLRKALSYDGNEGNYIQTVSGHGYRFLADVRKIDSPANLPSAEKRRLAANSKGRPINRTILISAATIILASSLTLILYGSLSNSKNKIPFDAGNIKQYKLTQDGNVVAPAISRDGRYLAFVCLKDDGQGICVRQIETENVLLIVPPRIGVSRWGATVSPDDGFVYYVSNDEGAENGVLRRIAVLGGQQIKLADNVSGYSISPDGKKLAIFRRDLRLGATSIVVTDIDGRNENTILTSKLDAAVFSLDWSPDGKNILYSIKPDPDDDHSRYIAEVPVAGGEEMRIPNLDYPKIGSIKWMPNKEGFIAVALDEATQFPQLYFISYPDGVVRRLTNDVNGHSSFSMTADAHTLVTAQVYDDRQIWTGILPDPASPRAITSDTERHFDTVCWAGNDMLVYDEDEQGGYRFRNIWKMMADGSGRKKLTFGNSFNAQPTVSPDGKTIVFVSKRSGKSQLWRMDIDGNEVSQLTEIVPNVSAPAFSATGKDIFFYAWADGTNQVWQISIDGGKAKPVIVGPDVRSFAASPDGSQLAYSYFDPAAAKVLTRVHSLNGGSDDILPEAAPETWMAWPGEGQSLFYNSQQDAAANIWRHDLVGKAASQISNFQGQRIYQCSWSPDGSRTACIRQDIKFDALMIRL